MSATPDEIDAQVAQLCAGYDRPFTPERRDAYRKSLGKMHPAMLERVVEFCLGASGPDRLPSCGQLWQISRQLRRARRAPGATAEEGPAMSRWAIAANKALLTLAYCDARRGFRPIAEFPSMPPGGYGLPLRLVQPTDRSLLDRVLAVKAEVVRYAEDAERSGEPWTDAEFLDVLRTAFEKLLTPREEASDAA